MSHAGVSVHKKRIRIKVTEPILLDSTSKIQNTMITSDTFLHCSDEKPSSHQEITENSEIQIFEENVKLTLSQPLMIGQIGNMESVGQKDSDDSDASDTIINKVPCDVSKTPVPAPRRKQPANSSGYNSETADVIVNATLLPQPVPRTASKITQRQQLSEEGVSSIYDGLTEANPENSSVKDVHVEDSADPEPAKQSKRMRKKKRKAAEMIANVLRRESKKASHVSTVLHDAEEKGEKDYGDIYSPWDSPPPPTNLEKVYIQQKHGFSVRDWCDFYSKPQEIEPMKTRCAADLAGTFHKVWSRLSVFSHGVVAGIACCHALSVAAALAYTQGQVSDFVQFYHFLSLKIHFSIYVFTSLCIVSCLDRLDVCQLGKDHLHDMGQCHGTLLVGFGYLVCLALGLAAHRHTAAIEVYASDQSLWDSQGLHEWTCLVTVRDALLLLCWVFMSCSMPRDLLMERLTSLSAMASAASQQQKPDLWHQTPLA